MNDENREGETQADATEGGGANQDAPDSGTTPAGRGKDFTDSGTLHDASKKAADDDHAVA